MLASGQFSCCRLEANIDILELVKRHPDLFARILAKSTGALGEIMVADVLLCLGYSVRPTNNNARQSDLVVSGADGLEFSIEIKSDRSRRPTWFVKTCPDDEASAFWIFVSAPRLATELPDPDQAEFFVLTATEAKAVWLASSWNERNPANGDIRRHQIPETAKNAWHKLPSAN